MGRRLRPLDAELARRGLARSRTHAAELIADGKVRINGMVAHKSTTQVQTSQAIEVEVTTDQPDYASRGGYKLAGALEALGERAPRLQGRCAIDAGASTGGFTDVLLRRGADRVYAVDVGYGLLAWALQTDPRVTVMDRTNVRYLKPEQFPHPPDLVVADLSFISLSQVLPALVRVALPHADFLLMVKPQFELGREHVGEDGVVNNPDLHAEAIEQVFQTARKLGLGTHSVVASPLPGPAGNVEYFVHLNQVGERHPDRHLITEAIAAGPAGKDL